MASNNGSERTGTFCGMDRGTLKRLVNGSTLYESFKRVMKHKFVHEKRYNILKSLGAWLAVCLLQQESTCNRRLNLHIVGGKGDTGKTMIAYVIASID